MATEGSQSWARAARRGVAAREAPGPIDACCDGCASPSPGRPLSASLGLALAAYKEQTGSYPDDLAALIPNFLDEIPLDPFTARPVIYRKEGDGFILYSIGPNLTDDDGMYVRDKRNQVEKDDISWRMPH